MNTESFDNNINLTFNNYGGVGVKAELLSADDNQTDRGEWMRVVAEVTVLDKDLTRYAEEWSFGGLSSHDKMPVPIGTRPIDRGNLIGAKRAAQQLPLDFPVPRASCTLYWALTPSMSEPCYFFRVEDVTVAVGAYTGHIYRS